MHYIIRSKIIQDLGYSACENHMISNHRSSSVGRTVLTKGLRIAPQLTASTPGKAWNHCRGRNRTLAGRNEVDTSRPSKKRIQVDIDVWLKDASSTLRFCIVWIF